MISITFFAAVFSAILAAIVISLNSRRLPNRALATLLLIQCGWLGSIVGTMRAGEAIRQGTPTDLTVWLRLNSLILATLPWCAWHLKTRISSSAANHARPRGPSAATLWISITVLLIALSLSESFAYKTAEGEIKRGTAYYAFISIGLASFITLIIETYRESKHQQGIFRLELQLLVINTAAGGLVITILNALGNYLGNRTFNRASVIGVFLITVMTAWALVSPRVFNSRQIFFIIGQKIFLGSILAGTSWALAQVFAYSFSETVAWFISIALCSTSFFWVEKNTRRAFGVSDDYAAQLLRKSILELSPSGAQSLRLKTSFSNLFKNEFNVKFAIILSDHDFIWGDAVIGIKKDRIGLASLYERSWITPETIQRQSPSASRADLLRFLQAHEIALLLAVPAGAPNPSFLVALGAKASEAPFTYPEVNRLQNACELIDNILARSSLQSQSALQDKMDYLALLSRGLAHDLKNLLTPISAFLIHTEKRPVTQTIETEVHTASSRSIRVINDYVREALFFSEHLTLKIDQVNLAETFTLTHQLTADKARAQGVQLAFTNSFNRPLPADRALLQRVLVNLVNNAIDASGEGQTIAISAAENQSGWLTLLVVDPGEGISPENCERIFEPYFTTKTLGDESRGFGLGLTICQKIVHLHGGKINAESNLGNGARFRVDLPTTACMTEPCSTPLDDRT